MKGLLQNLIHSEFILYKLEASDKEAALSQMASFLIQKGCCHKSFKEAILQRERVNPSALPLQGFNIAIPHTDAEHVIQSSLLLASLKKPINFQTMGSPNNITPVFIISMFALKEAEEIGNMLSELITAYQKKELRQSIWKARSQEHIYEILMQELNK